MASGRRVGSQRPERAAWASPATSPGPDSRPRTAGGSGGGPRGRGGRESPVPTAVLASAQPSRGWRARSDTASRPSLPPSSPLPQFPAATHRTGTGCSAKEFPAGRGTQSPGTSVNRNRLYSTGRRRSSRRGGEGVGQEVRERRVTGSWDACARWPGLRSQGSV